MTLLTTQQLDDLKQVGLYRSRRMMTAVNEVYVRVEGRDVINFCSNDYLGLSRHPRLVTAFQKAANQYGVGSGSAHLVCGHHLEHHALEEELADFTGRERALLFSTGYMANIGVIAGLMTKSDVVYEDKLNHASLLDGGLLSGANFKRYLHNDVANLRLKIARQTAKSSMIVTDGVFSMDGDSADLKALSVLAAEYKSVLFVDDAHGLGVLGTTGAGLVEQCGLAQQQVPLLMGTFGKAFGTSGAFVAGSEQMIETLIQKARTYIYTTALPPAIAAATRVSLKIIKTDKARREHLNAIIKQFKTGAAQIACPLMPSDTAIQPILIGDSERALSISEALLKQGFLVSAIRPPTVPKESARLRVTLSAQHSGEHVDGLLSALDKVLA